MTSNLTTTANFSERAMKILIVDDDIVSRMMLMHLIAACGQFDIAEAEDGLDAWQQLDGGLRPAILFCDARMPRLSGMALLERIREEGDSALAAMPFVLVSSAHEPALQQQALDAGATAYIVKPFRAEGLRADLQALLDRAGAEAAR
jgi:two-component system chemotaxis response regulator CheY